MRVESARSIKEFNIDFILGLYKKYIFDLKIVREYQRNLYYQKGYSRFGSFTFRALRFFIKCVRTQEIVVELHNKIAGLDDIESEITYLLIREFKPKIVVEISPGRGWSTSWILNSIKDNGSGELYSYDLVDDSTKTIPLDLSESRWTFIKGDMKKNIDKLPNKIDYLFIDSNHSAKFAYWYIQNIFPKLKNGIPISVHDVFHTADPSSFGGEGGVIINWLKQKEIKYFTCSPAKEIAAYNKIISIKDKLHIENPIHLGQDNPMIFFIFSRARNLELYESAHKMVRG